MAHPGALKNARTTGTILRVATRTAPLARSSSTTFVTKGRRHVERRAAALVLRVDVGTLCQQAGHQLAVTCLCGPVQRGFLLRTQPGWTTEPVRRDCAARNP
jgi:hypothetical protein